MTLPNALTILRVVLAVLVIYFTIQNTLSGLVLALIIFLLGMATDFADGIIARRFKLISNFGKIADPIADKILTLGTFLAFTLMGLLNIWILILVALREISLTVIRLIALNKNTVMAAEKLGKIKTASQMIIIVFLYCLLIFNAITSNDVPQTLVDVLMLYILFITLLSGINFLWNNKTTLKTLWIK